MKCIPLPTQKEYILQLLHSVEKFIRSLKWRAHFYLKPNEHPSKETFGFRSIRAAPKVDELDHLVQRLYDLVLHVEFRNFDNQFLSKLRSDLNDINETAELIVSADKTSNHYKLSKEEYTELLNKNIHTDYETAEPADVTSARDDQKQIVNKLELDDRVMTTSNRKAFVTLKDTKPNFQNNPKCRLISPTKPEIGRISKQILTRIVNGVKSKTKLQLWKNTDSVITWFQNLQNKQDLRFVSFDIQDYYASINEELFTDAINWARNYVTITDDEEEVIMKSKKSFLYDGKDLWKKKEDKDFNITMGSFDGAESTDLVGLFLLNQLKKVKVQGHAINIGLYRDDALLVSRLTTRQTAKLVDDLVKVLKHPYGLTVTIDANHKIIDFLDVKFNLNTGLFQPYQKPNNKILYVHSKSNHPPATTKNIVKNIQNRLSRLSATEEIFNEAKAPYEDALKQGDYDFNLKYDPNARNSENKNRKRNRRVTWFNPPFSYNVKTNIGAEFLKIISECFPQHHKLYKICNRNTLKLSYRTMPNMKRAVSNHNNKILDGAQVELAGCTQVCDDTCPLPGNCKVTNVVYRATITREDNGHQDTYTGATYRRFKSRYNEHMNDCRNPARDGTTLSNHVWSLKRRNIPYNIKWEIVGRASPFTPVTGMCRLCLLEKYHIMYNKWGATLNQRSEFFSHCYHKDPLLLSR